LNNSKSAESEEDAITKVVPNYTFFFHKINGNFSHPLDIFPVDYSISAFIFKLEKIAAQPTCQWH
jgi:hypothetical protein